MSVHRCGKKIAVGIVGLGFGAEFVPIYLDHPDVSHVAICDARQERRDRVGDRFKIGDRCAEISELIARTDIDAIHLVSGIPDHARQTVAVLESGKHCACTVPMATSLADMERIVAAKRTSQRNWRRRCTRASSFSPACCAPVVGHVQGALDRGRTVDDHTQARLNVLRDP